MPGGGESTRVVVYCVVPRDLAAKLYEPLRDHFRGERGVAVVVERRREADRRTAANRRRASAGARERAERRTIRSASGRRIGERRALTTTVSPPVPLPKKARRHEARLKFVERLEPSAQALQDADSKRLVTRFQAGEAAVFGELYLRYFNAVYTYARVGLRDHHEAEDVTQQVFTKALAALGRYELRPSVPFRGWLFSIARNVIVDAVRQQHGMVLEPPDLVDGLRGAASVPSARFETLGWLSDREIAMFVERLPLPQRQVLMLRFMLDLSGEEIAQVLGKSHTAVRKLLSRALEALEDRLAAVGRVAPSRRGAPRPMLVRLKPLPVMARRRFALAEGNPRRAA